MAEMASQLRQEVSDLNIPIIHDGTGLVRDVSKDVQVASGSVADMLNFPTSYGALTTQGKLMLWASGIMIFVQIVTMLTSMKTSATSVMVTLVTLLVGLVFMAYYTYNINCLVTGGCGIFAYVLAGIMALNTFFMLVSLLVGKKSQQVIMMPSSKMGRRRGRRAGRR